MKRLAALAMVTALLSLAAGPVHDPDDVGRFGAGSFGLWNYDEEFLGLSYLYTMDPADPRAQWDPKVYPVNNLHWHQLGNRRVTANAYNLGFVKLFYGETGAYWLNEYEPEKNEFSGGFGWIVDGETVLIDRASETLRGDDSGQAFGTGYLTRGMILPEVSFYRYVGASSLQPDLPYLLSTVHIKNTSDQPKEFTFIEYWDVNMRLVDDFLLLGSLMDKGRDYRMNVELHDSTLWAIPVDRPPKGKAPTKPTLVYPYLPSIFLASSEPPEAWIINPDELFQDGAPRRDPTALSKAGDPNPAGSRLSQDRLCLAARFKLRLDPGEQKDLVFAYGYQSPLEEKAPSSISPLPKWDDAYYSMIAKWRFPAVPYLDLPGARFLGRELMWDYYYLTSSAIWDGYYQKHHIPQGANYLYYSGGNGATRDYAAFVMTLAYYQPELAREVLEFMARCQDPDGRMFYDLEGFGKRYTVPYRPGDLDLWYLWALAEYVFATRDFAFLDQVEPFYPMDGGQSATVWEHARRSLDHLINVVGTGPHGHPKLRLSDWNDEMTWLTAGSNPLEMLMTFKQGESVMNTAMAVYIMPMAADLARARGDEITANKAEAYLAKMRTALQSAWHEDHLIRSYSGLGQPFGTDVMYLEPQAWALLAGDALSPEQYQSMIHAIDERLIKPSPLGMIISNSVSGSLTTRKGEQEEGGIWFAINGPAAVGLANFDQKLAWDQVLRNTLAWHAELYPDLWYGIWSGPDAWNSIVSERPGETWYMKSAIMNTGPQMYPIQNAHAHCQTMWAVARLAGVTPTARGWTIEPRIPAPKYSLICALFSLSVEPDNISGWASPKSPLEITLRLPPNWEGKPIIVKIDNQEVSAVREKESVIFTLPASTGEVQWQARQVSP